MSSAPWLDVALSYRGTREWPGERHNPRIIRWLKRHALNLGRWGKSRDETAWCAVFVSACLAEAGFQGTDHALAYSYVSFGRPTRFRRGAIIVIKRKQQGPDEATGSRRGYHVGFLLRVTKNHYVILGGNQRNQVKVSYYPKKAYELEALRWPEERLARKTKPRGPRALLGVGP